MRKTFTLFFFISIVFTSAFSQVTPPTKEFRAVWLSTVSNLDYPKTTGAAAQTAELISIIEALKSREFNTVVLQVRSRGDLLYPSAIEPWAAAMTGQLGKDPGWDPLQKAIEECHKRGMELHAWWNFSLVANGTTAPSSVGLPHVAAAHPTYAKAAGTQLFMDIGLPEVRAYLVDLAMEMVRKYDIDAIHFDYIRYLENVTTAFDATTYSTYGGNMSLADWRRENINMCVRAMYDSIKKVKPWVKVGSTPIGNYKAGVAGVGPALYGYTDCFQDSRRWMLEGKHDYLAPQIYWDLTGKYPYNIILKNWVENCGARHVYGGIAAYKNDPATTSNNVYNQIGDIIDYTRSLKANGEIFFRYDNITPGNFFGLKGRYAYPANIPPMPWIDSVPPGTPKNLKVTKVDDKTFTFTWDKASSGTDGDTAKYYNIYQSTSSVINFNDAANLLYITTNTNNIFTVKFYAPPEENYYYAVSALDRNNVESPASNIVPVIVTGIADLNNPSGFHLEQNYPNPFNPATHIAYSLSSHGNVKLSVYNVLGQEISTLVNEAKDAGRYIVNFNASNFSSGLYIYKIQITTNNRTFVDYKKMLLTK